MAIYNNGEVETIRESLDLDENVAHPASDERLEQLRQQGVNGSLVQRTVRVADTPPSERPVPDGVAVEVQAHHDNEEIVYVGSADAQERALAGREFTTFRLGDLSELHARGSGTDRLVLTFTEVES
jgi:hypothetical protein